MIPTLPVTAGSSWPSFCHYPPPPKVEDQNDCICGNRRYFDDPSMGTLHDPDESHECFADGCADRVCPNSQVKCSECGDGFCSAHCGPTTGGKLFCVGCKLTIADEYELNLIDQAISAARQGLRSKPELLAALQGALERIGG
jgi:hypothetical protein